MTLAHTLVDNRTYPCSWDQARVLTDYAAGVAPYDGPVRKRWIVEGELSRERLRAAWLTILGRHPALRVGFTREATGRWTQTVLPLAAVEDWVVIADEKSPADIEQAWRRVDLATGRLFQVVLVRTGPRTVLIDLSAHLAAFDGASLTVILEEVGALLGDHTLAEPELDVGFLEFCAEFVTDGADGSSAGPRYRPSGWTRRGPVLDLAPPSCPPGHSGLDIVDFRVDWADTATELRGHSSGLGLALLLGHLTRTGLVDSYGEVPVVVGVFGRPLGYHQAVGRFYSESVLGFSVRDRPFAEAARRISGKLLRTARDPITPLSYELLHTAPDPRMRAHRGDRSPDYLFAVHTSKREPFEIDDAEVTPVEVPDATNASDIGLLQVRSVVDDEGVDFTVYARREILGTGFAESVATHAIAEFDRVRVPVTPAAR